MGDDFRQLFEQGLGHEDNKNQTKFDLIINQILFKKCLAP
jgi:hypothetical protein